MNQAKKNGCAARGKLRRLRSLLLVAVFGMLAVGGSVVVVLASNPFGMATAQPNAVFPTTQRDFGKIKAGGKLTAQFEVKNTGGRRLIINALSGSCDCLAPGKAEVVVPPGGSRGLPVVLNTERLRGSMRMALRFATNDPQHPKVEFVIIADVAVSTESNSEAPLTPIAASR